MIPEGGVWGGNLEREFEEFRKLNRLLSMRHAQYAPHFGFASAVPTESSVGGMSSHPKAHIHASSSDPGLFHPQAGSVGFEQR